jgi:uncharacterized protein
VLTAELTSARRRGGELRLAAIDLRLVEALAAAMAEVARAHVGRTRAELEEALRFAGVELVAGAGGGQRLAAAVGKLVRDRCRFEDMDGEAAMALRREVFRHAAAARRGAGGFDRAAILADVAASRGTTVEVLEAGLFADRAAAQKLVAVEVPPPGVLARGFELAEAQAVLLRATKIVARVRARDANLYRHLFRTLKFLRLLPVISRGKTGVTIEIDGPLSLFQGGTKYGLALALALPAIAACDAWAIDADVRWGAERRPVRFRIEGAGAELDDARDPAPPPDELAAFVPAFERLATGWRIEREPAVLDLPGAGLCVPDLAFVRARDGARVFFELLGFWSREAVFRRIDLVRAGLRARILFAASKTLRVGEALLDDAPSAALYVFSRVLAPKEILARINALAPEAGR